jgi:hypothetical protein
MMTSSAHALAAADSTSTGMRHQVSVRVVGATVTLTPSACATR